MIPTPFFTLQGFDRLREGAPDIADDLSWSSYSAAAWRAVRAGVADPVLLDSEAVEHMLAWCRRSDRACDSNARAEYAAHLLAAVVVPQGSA